MIEDRIFTKHAAERFLERYPNTDFKMAISNTTRTKRIDKNHKKIYARKEKKGKCKIYTSWLGMIFVVVGNYVVTVY